MMRRSFVQFSYENVCLTPFSSFIQIPLFSATQDLSTLQRLRERRERERARQGLHLVEHWLQQTSQALEHAVGFRAS